MFWMVAAMVGLVAGVAGLKLLLHPASGLRLNVFRPWQGDPWPRGVQEEDGVRFDCSRPDPLAGAVEELPGGAVGVDQLDAIDIHRPRH